MILAAGQGTRVRPLTKNLPKPMIPVLGKPVMEYLIEHLVRHGVTEIMVNVGHHHHMIENYFGDGHRWGAQIGYSYEGVYDHGDIKPSPFGSAGGMRHIQDFSGFFDQTTIVICGDALIDLDITTALFEHINKNALVSIVAKEVPNHEVVQYGIVQTDDNGRITGFQEKPKQEEALSNLASTGIYFFEPEALKLIPKNTFFDIGSQLFPMLVEKNYPFFAQKRFYNWVDIGQIADYWLVMQRILQGEVSYIEMPGVEVKPGIWVGINTRIDWDNITIEGPVYIGSGTHIESGAKIVGPCWISHGCQIKKNSQIIRSILFEYTRVSKNMLVDELVISATYCVNRKSETFYVGDDRCTLKWGDARVKT